MLHAGLKWIVLFMCWSVVSNVSAQVVGLQMGSHLIPDKVLFEKPLSNSPRPFMFVGLTYYTTEVTMGISYTFDLRIVTISSQIPLWNLNRKKHNYALLNNRKWE